MTQKISLTRALALAKNAALRIDTSIAQSTFVGLLKGGKPTVPGQTKESLEQRIKGDLMSVEAQIENLIKLKAAISKANETTDVKIGGRVMNINGAIFLKKATEFRQRLLAQIRHAYNNASRQIEASEAAATKEIQQALVTMLGAEKSRGASAETSSLQEVASKAIRDLHVLTLLDPINVNETIVRLQKEVDSVLEEIDFALSEVNAKTEIEIETV